MHTSLAVMRGCRNTSRVVASSGTSAEKDAEIRSAVIRVDRNNSETPAFMKTGTRFCDCVPAATAAFAAAASSQRIRNAVVSCSCIPNPHFQHRVRKRSHPPFFFSLPRDSLPAGVSFGDEFISGVNMKLTRIREKIRHIRASDKFDRYGHFVFSCVTPLSIFLCVKLAAFSLSIPLPHPSSLTTEATEGCDSRHAPAGWRSHSSHPSSGRRAWI